MSPTYQALRTAHFRLTLKNWFKGLDKALLAVFAVLQFILTAILAMLVFWLAHALILLQNPATRLDERLLIVGAWQATSFILLRALREAALMPRAAAFFDALPVTPPQKLRADVTLALQSYSLLWLPVAWAVANPAADISAHASPIALLELVSLSLCVNITLLRGAIRSAWLSLGALTLFAATMLTGIPGEAARFACAMLGGFSLWLSYLPGGVPVRPPKTRRVFADRLAVGSGLVIPLLMNELRSNLLVRIGLIAATFGACLIVIHLRAGNAASASVEIFVAAAAAIALYSLPALCRSVLLGKLHFLAGHPAFAQRMRLAAYAIPAGLFAAALALAWPFDRSGTALRDASMFSALFVGGIIGARLDVQAIRWVMPLCCMIALIIMSAML